MSLNVDKEGFLRNLGDWDAEVARQLAAIDNIELTDSHWEVIHLVRHYYDRYRISPANRVLVNVIKKQCGPEKGSSIYLMKLFTGKPAKVLSRIAGLPKPDNCD